MPELPNNLNENIAADIANILTQPINDTVEVSKTQATDKNWF